MLQEQEIFPFKFHCQLPMLRLHRQRIVGGLLPFGREDQGAILKDASVFKTVRGYDLS